MIITGVALQNFRLHKSYFIKFEKQTTVIVGANAVGKTSIIEAINLLATGNSFRAGRVEEMISFETDLARVKGVILDEQGYSDEVEILLTRGMVNGKRTQYRLFTLNGVRKRKKDVVGKFYTVVFRPEDMRLIEGSPSRRRSFLNNILSLMYPSYELALKSYQQTLVRRNKLLQQVREKQQARTVLQYWNINLVKNGEILQQYRQEFLASFKSVQFPVNFRVEYDPSIISEDRLKQYLYKEIAAGHTLIGPHKDDFIVFLDQDNHQLRLDTYGSRGQQRLGVLWLKFCELEYLQFKGHKNTVLLLDDILSELDDESKALALSILGNYQAVVTTTEPSVLEDIKQATTQIETIELKL